MRLQVTDFVRQRGTSKQPAPPRDLIAQSSARGVSVVWGLPSGANPDIAGWRVYSGDENTLVGKIADRGTRNFTVPANSGSTPPSNNIFVSSVNALGVESPKVQIQGKATVEAGAPALAVPPAGYIQGNGSDLTANLGTRTFVTPKL
jgi:hypothetical protein